MGLTTSFDSQHRWKLPSRPALAPVQASCEMGTGGGGGSGRFPDGKAAGAWSYASTPTYVFMGWWIRTGTVLLYSQWCKKHRLHRHIFRNPKANRTRITSPRNSI